jgi:hypothetical protein
MSEDNVNHPRHYTSSESVCSSCGHSIECIDVVRHMGFNVGNIVKYLWRFKDKNGLEDLKKARWYLEDLINQFDKKPEPGCQHIWDFKTIEGNNSFRGFSFCTLCGTQQ